MILNLHGIDGSSTNTNYRLLLERFPVHEIYSPQIDYRSDLFENILSILRFKIHSFDSLKFIVGNSYGGFIATILANEFSVPYILSNPCLRPDKIIDDLVPGYLRINNEVNSYVEKIYNSYKFKNAHVILGNHDEVINTADTLEVLDHETDIAIIDGGHRLSGEIYGKKFLERVDKIVKSN